MGQSLAATTVPYVDPQSLRRLETNFLAPDLRSRNDVVLRQSKLAQIVSDDIIPRLLRLHERTAAPSPAVILKALVPSSEDVSGLADLILGTDLKAAIAYVLVLRDRGLSMDTLFLELLEPTARLLGEMWDRDECDFIDVTLGVGRLQQLLAVFNETHDIPDLDEKRHVLLAMTPGDQHFFGLRMVEKFLLAAGWRVETVIGGTCQEICTAAESQWFALAGLTAGSERHLDSLHSTITEVRRVSRNPEIGIMVGGPMFTANPSLAQEVGADATASNATTAVLAAQRLFDLASTRLKKA